jgi:hypothetical protein
MIDTQCDLVTIDGDDRERCPDRAEYAVRAVDDQLFVCGRHRGWALGRLGERALRTDLLHPEDWPSGFAGLWTTGQVAQHCGVNPGTYRDYVSRLDAPGPVDARDPVTGAKLYDAAAVKAWHANRPGKGWRGSQVSDEIATA